jgi:simple sugar transport system substrate-binding protein/ribose transport system substrate-binding protein
LLGPAAFDAVAKILAGETLATKTVVKDELFEQAVAKEVLPTRQY